MKSFPQPQSFDVEPGAPNGLRSSVSLLQSQSSSRSRRLLSRRLSLRSQSRSLSQSRLRSRSRSQLRLRLSSQHTQRSKQLLLQNSRNSKIQKLIIFSITPLFLIYGAFYIWFPDFLFMFYSFLPTISSFIYRKVSFSPSCASLCSKNSKVFLVSSCIHDPALPF